MMFEISEVVLANTTKIIQDRDKKLFVRISVTNEKFLIINSRESEGSIKIESATYSFLRHDSYIASFRTFVLKEDEIIKKLETLNYDDMVKILNMIKNSKFISQDEKEEIVIDLEEYITNYTKNKLKNKFNKR
ncbi:MAG: hypothetical protein LBU89_13815 [Fibromonadaceae bacterium]|nr:hypothetical protein [Fibromonadaceae bacterium]